MKSVVDIFELYISGKAKSRVVGLFFSWLIIFHIHVVFTALFVSQEIVFQKYGLLKGEYILEKVLRYGHTWFWGYELVVIALSACLTWLMIWVLPATLLKAAYSKELEDEYDRKHLKLAKEINLENKRAELLDTKIDVVKKEEEVIEKQEAIENKEQQAWEKDYRIFKKSDYFHHFRTIIEAVYRDGGDIKVYDDEGFDTERLKLPTEALAYFDARSIISIPRYGTIELTPKGRYFLEQFQS